MIIFASVYSVFSSVANRELVESQLFAIVLHIGRGRQRRGQRGPASSLRMIQTHAESTRVVRAEFPPRFERQMRESVVAFGQLLDNVERELHVGKKGQKAGVDHFGRLRHVREQERRLEAFRLVLLLLIDDRRRGRGRVVETRAC